MAARTVKKSEVIFSIKDLKGVALENVMMSNKFLINVKNWKLSWNFELTFILWDSYFQYKFEKIYNWSFSCSFINVSWWEKKKLFGNIPRMAESSKMSKTTKTETWPMWNSFFTAHGVLD